MIDLAERAAEAAARVLALRYPEATAAFVAGSIMRGEGTEFSDIDCVVLFDRLANARRESFAFEGFPVEAFVHDPQTLRWFMDDDAASGRPCIVHMVAEGRLIGPRVADAMRLKSEAVARLAEGPKRLEGEQLDALRYAISDLLDDLRGTRSAAEMRAIGAQLQKAAADLILLGRGRWTGSAKWIPRLIKAVDADLAQRFDAAFCKLWIDAQGNEVIALLEKELDRHGGPLFDGYCRDAPAQNRRVA
ncbi:MAG TPA: nucleotidyltransferase domain-containing protein [Steroidobacteraceae bacterium]